MQQAFYSPPAIKAVAQTAPQAVAQTAPQAARPSLGHHLARRWDLYGVLALMASSAAYALAALTHLA